MNESHITLNLPLDLSSNDWEIVARAFSEMDGWIPNQEYSCWFGKYGDEQYIIGSAEPSGLQITGNLEPSWFYGWVTKLCAKLTLALRREVHDAEV